MLTKILKPSKPRVFMASLVVVPRSEWKRSDEWGLFKSEKLDDETRERLESIFSLLPPANSVQDLNDNDLGLDVLVPMVQGAELTSTMTHPYAFPILWRPKIQIKSRLFYLKSQRTKQTFLITEKMPRKEYIAGILSLRAFFRYKPIFVAKDLEPMLFRACEKLMKRMVKSI